MAEQRLTADVAARMATELERALDCIPKAPTILSEPHLSCDPETGVLTISLPSPPIVRIRQDVNLETAAELIRLAVIDALYAETDRED